MLLVAGFLCQRVRSFFLIATILVPALVHASPQTALDDYVNNANPGVFDFQLAGPPLPGDGFKLYVVYMSSQQWRSDTEVDRTLWTHWMAMIVPDQVLTDTGMMIIGGGDNTPAPDLGAGEVLVAAEIAKNSGTVVSVLGQVPNQPLFFADEPFAHSEDELVAYTYDKAMNSGDWTWPAYLPMTLASVRAMDTVQALTQTPAITAVPVNQFVVTGFSKRGAITWLSAVVDPRVRAIAPGVFDVLNLDEQIEHHFSAYGFYSGALDDYVNYNILRRMRTPEGQALKQVVDPLSYKDRLTMPKFILNSSGDSFFTSDSSQFYFDQLQGEKRLRYVANTGHGLETAPDNVEDALTSLVSWYLSTIYNVPRPTINWRHENGQLIVQTDPTQPVLLARLWQAHNPAARDFRLDTIGRSWIPTLLAPTSPGTYSVPVPENSEGWTAYFVDLIFPGVAGVPQTYSTSIFVTPDTLPYEVTDPLLDPRGVGFWRRQVLGDKKVKIPAEVLAGYLPIPLFDQYVNTIEDAAAVFTARNRDARARARKQCLALRLNVRDGQLGWYTSIELDGDHRYHDEESRKLWEVYTEAHEAFLEGKPKKAMAICAGVNAL